MIVKADATRFLPGDGEMARLISRFNWSQTSLGPMRTWPQSMRTTLALMLRSPVPMISAWNKDGVMIYNDAYARFAGNRHPSLLGLPVREGWAEVTDFCDHFMRSCLSGETLEFVDREMVLNRSGTPEAAILDLYFWPLHDEHGVVRGAMSIVLENTAKVQLDRRLETERGRLTRMFEQAPGFMAILSGPDHIFDMANAAFMRLIGEREVLGHAVREAVPEVIKQGFGELLDEVRRSGQSHVGRGTSVKLQRHPALPIEERFVDFVFQPIFGDDGNCAAIFVQGNDVTNHRRAQIALRRETRHLEVLNRLAAELSAELDLEKVVQMTTDAGVELTGAQFGAFFYNERDENGEFYRLYALSGAHKDAFLNTPMPRNTEVFAATFNGCGVIRSPDILSDPRYGRNAPHQGMPEGHLPVRSYLAVPVVSRSGEVLGGLLFGHTEVGKFREEHERVVVGAAGQVAIAIDNARLFRAVERELGERRRAEEALQVLNAGLEQKVAVEIAGRMKTEEVLRQSQKMEALGQLTGGVAHDFNNLLQVISGNLQLLIKDVESDAKARRRVDNALAGVQRGAKLASQLLAFGRRQPLEPKVIGIGRFLNSMEELLRRTLGENIEVDTNCAVGLWNVLVDPAQMENALLNLAINARDAMEGGKLTIEASNVVLDERYARQNTDVAPGNYVMLAVTDTGTGIPAEIVDQVFEPFFSTKPVGKGTGLGLSMVYGFVRQSGGHVKIVSELGEGTTVKLYFPQDLRGEDFVSEIDSGPLVGGDETILVAEDDEEVRITVVDLLTELGYRVLKAKDAASALSVIESGVRIDLLFTDVVMPGPLKSTELAAQVRLRQPDIAVLFTSGYTENSIVHDGRLDQGVELLSKPYTREALARKIRHVLHIRDNRLVPAERAPALVAEHYAKEKEIRSPSVLLVEDEALIRMSSSDILSELGYEVAEAASAEIALRMLEERVFDVIMTDIGLPGLSGCEFAKQARAIAPRIGIIFATGDRHIPDALALDGAVLLQKPYGGDDIADAMARVCQGIVGTGFP